jgi:hypothetical protein
MNPTKSYRALLGITLASLIVLSFIPAATALRQTEERTPVYVIHNVTNAATRSAIAATGAHIFEIGNDYVLVEATRKEKRALEGLGLTVSELPETNLMITAVPAADSGYHDYPG